MKELKEIFSQNLIALRTEGKMTQLELGNAIGYSDKAISKWERGEAVPDAYVLLSLAEMFGVTVDFLLKDHGGDKAPRRKKTNYKSIVAVSVMAVWMAFATAYIAVLLAVRSYPLLFMYATVVSFILLIVFNSIWGKRRNNVFFVSALVVSIITTVYLIFLDAGHNFWQILLLNIPAVLIVVGCFHIKISVSDFLRVLERKTKDNIKND